jgi:hypothetical protein
MLYYNDNTGRYSEGTPSTIDEEIDIEDYRLDPEWLNEIKWKQLEQPEKPAKVIDEETIVNIAQIVASNPDAACEIRQEIKAETRHLARLGCGLVLGMVVDYIARKRGKQ